MCAVMAQGRSAFKANGSRSASRSLASTPAAPDGCPRRARPWPGACLPTGCMPAASSPAASARPSRATACGSRRQRPVADHARVRQACAGPAPAPLTTSKPPAGAVQADQRAGQPGRAQACAGIAREQCARARRPADARASAAAAAARRGRPPDRPSAPRHAASTRRSAAIRRRSWPGSGCCGRTG